MRKVQLLDMRGVTYVTSRKASSNNYSWIQDGLGRWYSRGTVLLHLILHQPKEHNPVPDPVHRLSQGSPIKLRTAHATTEHEYLFPQIKPTGIELIEGFASDFASTPAMRSAGEKGEFRKVTLTGC